MVFFSQYGQLSWVLILLAVGMMCGLNALLMRKMKHCVSTHWCAIYRGNSSTTQWAGQGCVFLLMSLTGGAMVSAAGHLVALVVPVHGAYWMGLICTVLLAYVCAQKKIRVLAIISGFLTCFILVSYALIMAHGEPQPAPISIRQPLTALMGLKAFLFAAAYASMNMAIALGVVCGSEIKNVRSICRTSVLFGLVLLGLLFVSNYVLLQHEGLVDAAFPIVMMLAGLGRFGFFLSVMVLYLAVFTTLVATLSALQNVVASHGAPKPVQIGVTLGAPAIFSLIGFQAIVERGYAPIGLACLLLIFLPTLFLRRKKGGLSTSLPGKSM